MSEVVRVAHLAQAIEVTRWFDRSDTPAHRVSDASFTPRRMSKHDFIDGHGKWHPEGLASFARILRLAKERREQAVIGAAFDAARGAP